MPRLHVSASKFQELGELTLGGRLGVGGDTLESSFPVREGLWNAYYLDEETIDDLLDDGVLEENDDEEYPPQLLLVHEERDLPTKKEVASLQEVARFSIEGARFVAADAGLDAELAASDGFEKHLDGVEGVLANGRGVTASMSGDGKGIVFAERGKAPTLVLVECP